MLKPILLILAAISMYSSGKDDKSDKKSDKELLLGTWSFESLESDGKKLKELGSFEYLKDMKLTFKGEHVQRYAGPKEKPEKAKLVLGDKTLDMVVLDEKDQAKGTEYGLYDLKGDTLRLCYGPNLLTERPKTFDSMKGQTLLTFKREKPGK